MVSDPFLQAAAGSTCSGPLPITASPATVGSSGSILNASAKDGAWRTKPAETAVSRSLPAWPLRDGAFSGTPGGAALATYPREAARCEQGVLYGCGPAQVGFGATCSPPFLTSPFVLLVNLVRATAAHAPFQGYGFYPSPYPGRCPGLACLAPSGQEKTGTAPKSGAVQLRNTPRFPQSAKGSQR
jgi:hypothetical protein